MSVMYTREVSAAARRRPSTALRFSISFSHGHSYLTLVLQMSASADIESPIERTGIPDCSGGTGSGFRRGPSYLGSWPWSIFRFLNMSCEHTIKLTQVCKAAATQCLQFGLILKQNYISL